MFSAQKTLDHNLHHLYQLPATSTITRTATRRKRRKKRKREKSSSSRVMDGNGKKGKEMKDFQ